MLADAALAFSLNYTVPHWYNLPETGSHGESKNAGTFRSQASKVWGESDRAGQYTQYLLLSDCSSQAGVSQKEVGGGTIALL